MKRLFLFLLFISIVLFPLLSQANPFISRGDSKPNQQIVRPVNQGSRFIAVINSIQKILREYLTTYMKQIKEDKSYKTIVQLLFISFLYGFVHAAGPGHRKSVMFSYFLSEDADIIKGLIAGISFAFLHAGSAVVIVLTLYTFIKRSILSSFENINYLMEMTSYAAIAAMGLILFSIKIITLIKKKKESKASRSNRSLTAIVLSSGIVPCPGAATILLFSISMQVKWIGILSVIFMSIGMAIVISAVSVLTVISKQKMLTLFKKKTKTRFIIQEGIEISGAVLVFLFGLFMFLPFILSS